LADIERSEEKNVFRLCAAIVLHSLSAHLVKFVQFLIRFSRISRMRVKREILRAMRDRVTSHSNA
jgi:hypothetical protein